MILTSRGFKVDCISILQSTIATDNPVFVVLEYEVQHTKFHIYQVSNQSAH